TGAVDCLGRAVEAADQVARVDIAAPPAPFEVEVVARVVAEVEREGAVLEAGEDQGPGRRSEPEPDRVEGAGSQQGLGLGLGHRGRLPAVRAVRKTSG